MRTLLIVFVLVFNIAKAEELPKRIISTSGDITEIIYKLDQQDKLVGVDTTSYYPIEAKKLPKIGYKRTLSAEGILSLKPDLIITSNDAGPPAALKQIESAGVKIIKIESDFNIESVINKVNIIAKLLGADRKGQELVKSIRQEVKTLNELTKYITQKPNIMFILQHGNSAPMVAGNNTAANAIIKLSGAKNVAEEYQGYKPLTPEAAVLYSPDIILITDQGLEANGGIEGLLKNPAIKLTKAAKNKNVISMDSLLLLGFNPRTPKTISTLVKLYKEKI